MRRILFTLVTGAAVLAAACSERAPLLPVQTAPRPSGPLGQLSCTVDVARRAMECGAPSTAPGVSGNIILGGQGLNVSLASSGTAYDSGTQQLTSNVTVQNLIAQPLATADGTTPDTSGVRVFFAQGPTVTAGTGSVSVVPDGVGNFLGAGEPYYQYAGNSLGADGILSRFEITAPRTWTFAVDPTVTQFSFIVYVWSTVPQPDGWVVVTPATDSVPTGSLVQLIDSVFSPTGRVRAGVHGWWSSSDTSVAQVDSATGSVFTLAPGTATITSHYGAISGSATVHVYARTAQYAAVTAGDETVCALDPNGHAYCWGNNRGGALGIGTIDSAFTTATAVPRSVAGGHVFTQLVSGFQSNCGLDTGGVAWCWGSNELGQLGVASTPQTCTWPNTHACSATPLQVSTAEHFTTLASDNNGGPQMCGVSTTGDTWCWGYNADGELGNGDTASAATLPVKVTGGHQFTQLALGPHRSCGVEAGGAVYCWGRHFAAYAAPAQATCVNGQYGCDPTPVALSGGLSLHGLTIGSEYACGLNGSGAAYCWGTNLFGGMGTGGTSDTDVSAPVAVSTSERFTQINAALGYTCGVTADHRAFCWGLNDMGQLGDGGTSARYVPTAVAGGYRFTSVSAGSLTTCGVTVYTAYCWGSGSTGQIGNGTLTSTNPLPLQVNDHP